MNAREAIKWSGGPLSVPLSGHLAHRAGDLEIDIAEDMEREFPPNRKDKSMASLNQESPREETPFDRLNDAVERLNAAEDQLSSLTDKLLGQRPPEQTAAGKLASVPSGGVFGNVDGVAIRVSALAEQIAGYTSRIARQIP